MRKSLLILAFLTAAPALAPAMPLSTKLVRAAQSVVSKDHADRLAAQRREARAVSSDAKALKAYVEAALKRPEVKRLFAAGETIKVGSQPFSLSANGLVSLHKTPVHVEHAAKLMIGKDWKSYLDEEVELRNARLDVVEKVNELRHSPEFQQALKVRSRNSDPQNLPSVELVAGFTLSVRGLTSMGRYGEMAEQALRNLDPSHFRGITAKEIEKRALKVIAPSEQE